VDLHGGTVAVAPTDGGGATFRLRFRAAPEAVEERVDESVEESVHAPLPAADGDTPTDRIHS
jgi:two-component system OmpR family sensor kinase